MTMLVEPARNHRYRDRWAQRLAEADLPADLDRLALVIAMAARNDGTAAMASNAWLAERLGASVATIKRKKEQLLTLALIEVEQRGGRQGDGTTRATTYRLVFSTAHDHAPDEPLSEPETVAQKWVDSGSISGEDRVAPDLNGSPERPQWLSENPSTAQAPAWDEPHPRGSYPRTEKGTSFGSDAGAPRATTRLQRVQRLQEALDEIGRGHLDAMAVWTWLGREKSIYYPDRFLDSLEREGRECDFETIMDYYDDPFDHVELHSSDRHTEAAG